MKTKKEIEKELIRVTKLYFHFNNKLAIGLPYEYESIAFGEQRATLEWVLSDTKKEKKK